jgi:hypothetical protein
MRCIWDQPPPEKKACPNEPKPPRVTPPAASAEPADDEWLVEPLLKKLERDDQWPPLPDELRLAQVVPGCAAEATPGEVGSQVEGISV